ncbi:MAG: PAS domain S-box protein [Candidatus Brocadiales bacterium]|nr:PAS domain S-box protein [Candidatus Brocadiales bacterium]
MYISIKSRLIMLLITFAVIPIILLRFVAYPRMQADLQDILIRNLDGVGHKQSELITHFLHDIINNASSFSDNPLITQCTHITRENSDYSKIIQYLETLKIKYDYEGIFICDKKGMITIATMDEPVGRDVSEKDYFRSAITGNLFISEIVLSEVPIMNEFGNKELGVPTMFASAPLKDDNGDITGIFCIRVDVSSLNNLMLSLKLGKTGETYLVNKEGYMVTESRFADDLRKQGLVKNRCTLALKLICTETGELTSGVKQCVAGNNGFDAKGYKDYRGKTVLGVWRWLPEFNLGVVAEIDKDEGYGPARNLQYRVSALLLIIAFPLLIVAYTIGKKITRPILILTEITKKIASGDLAQRVNVKRDDEIGELADSFNAMAKSLDEKTREIVTSEKRYRDLFNSIREGVYQSEPGVEGVFTFINKTGAEMLGYSNPEELIGIKVKNIYADSEDRRRLCEKLEKDGVWRDFVSVCKRKNGENFYAERTSSVVKDENDKPLYIYGVFRDISERKKTEQKVVESEKRYRLLFDSLSEGVYQSEPTEDGVFTWMNQAGAEILGYKSPGEVIGTKVKDIYVNPDDRKMVVEKLNKEGVWKSFTSFCKRNNGEQFYMERTFTLVNDEMGNPVRIDGIFRDITERKRMEEELQETVRHHRQLLNSLKEGIYQCEPTKDGVFTWINQAGAEILGYRLPEEVIGTKVKDIYVNPDERRRVVERLGKEGVLKNFSSLCKRKNGEHYFMERTSTIIKDESGNPIRIEGIFRDISERKKLEEDLRESERQLRGLLNSLKEGIYQCEPAEDGVFTWINQAGAEILGYKSPDEVIGTRIKEVYINPLEAKELMEKLEKDGVWKDFTSYCKRKNEEQFISENTCNLIRDESGNPIRIQGIFREITERESN